jgi:predicted AlkP superfamily pyrophosphatase or phosphodiesterase
MSQRQGLFLRITLALFSTASAVIPSFASDSGIKLVVVISIDQLPYGLFSELSGHFGKGGFRWLVEHGASFSNAQYEHAANLTGPGHAAISTGCYPDQHGIVANNWYSPETQSNVYCVEDRGVKTLGTEARGVSPRLLLLSTIGDELKETPENSSRVISISQKDRSAILMGGKKADAAYWLVDSQFVTSSYYMRLLPSWVAIFNRSGLATSFFGRTWNRLLSEEAYQGMDRDDAPYEGGGNGLGRTFPHPITGTDTTHVTSSYFGALWNSPFLNDLLIAFVKEAIVAESLGERESTDMLFIGLSANDAVGHTFGPNSHEVMDITLRTDLLLADLFRWIDDRVGLSRTLIVLTSDHGVAPIPEYMHEKHPEVFAGRVGSNTVGARCEEFVHLPHGESAISKVVDGNIYVDRQSLLTNGLLKDAVIMLLADSLKKEPFVSGLVTGPGENPNVPGTIIETRLRKNFYPGRSGDIVYALTPYFIDHSGTTGTDHGQPHQYDAHVPVILWGKGIRPGEYTSEASPVDIAPTIARILGIELSGVRAGRVLEEAIGD